MTPNCGSIPRDAGDLVGLPGYDSAWCRLAVNLFFLLHPVCSTTIAFHTRRRANFYRVGANQREISFSASGHPSIFLRRPRP